MKRAATFTFAQALLAASLSLGAATPEPSQAKLQARFDRIDKNGDGVITSNEIQRQAIFQKADANKDGQVTFVEAQTLLLAFRAGDDLKASAASPTTKPVSPEAAVNARIAGAKTISYAATSGVDPNLQSLDVYSDAGGAPPRPVVVMIHGGAWREGDKANAITGPRDGRFFNSQGFVYVAINYRLTPAVQHPAHVQDVAAALAWVADNISTFGGDPNRIFLISHSAGAHLAALVSTDSSYLKARGKSLSMIKGVILLDSAAYDIPRRMEMADGEGERTRILFSQAFGTDPQIWRQASPIAHVAAGKGIPPMLVFHVDRKESTVMAAEFEDVLAKDGVPSAIIRARGKSHREINEDIGKPGDGPTRVILDFLNGKKPKALPSAV